MGTAAEPPHQHAVGRRATEALRRCCALGHKPDLLVLDEPAASLDPVARRRFMQEILAIAGDSTRTLLYASHIIGDLERVASHIWMLRDGRAGLAGRTRPAEGIRGARAPARRITSWMPALRLPNQLLGGVAGRTAIVHGRAAGMKHSSRHCCSGLDVQGEVEPLELEEIFLALHA